MAEQSLIPQLPKDIIRIVAGYFDNFWVEGPGYSTWDMAKDYEDFQQNVIPRIHPRGHNDDDLFDGCSHAGGFYDVLQGKEAIAGIMGQLYREGWMSFHPTTVRRIAFNGGPFADWVANTFFMQLQNFQPPYRLSSKKQSFYDTITTNVEKHTLSLSRKLAKRKCDCL